MPRTSTETNDRLHHFIIFDCNDVDKSSVLLKNFWGLFHSAEVSRLGQGQWLNDRIIVTILAHAAVAASPSIYLVLTPCHVLEKIPLRAFPDARHGRERTAGGCHRFRQPTHWHAE